MRKGVRGEGGGDRGLRGGGERGGGERRGSEKGVERVYTRVERVVSPGMHCWWGSGGRTASSCRW